MGLRKHKENAFLFLSVLYLNCDVKRSRSVVSDSLRPHGLQPTRLFRLWDSPGKNTGVGCHFLLQGIFPTQGLNLGLLCLLDCKRILYLLSYQGSMLNTVSRNYYIIQTFSGFPGGSDGKASACNVGDLGSIPGLGRSPGEGNGNPLQYSCLENPTDGRAW